jgi:nucleotide-binding universal stress UspA family protein
MQRLRADMLPIQRILCPTDFSAPARTCVRTAGELAEHFGAELLLVNVVPVVPPLPPDPNYVFKIPEYERYLHADAERQLQKTREEVVGKNIKVRTMVGHGSAAEEIVRIAKAEGVDLIVISTHGSTGMQHWFFGSVAEKVVRLAECPVLTVREKKES